MYQQFSEKRRYFSLKNRQISGSLSVVCLITLFLSGLVSSANAAPTAIIYDNGTLATGSVARNGTAAPAGTQWSEASNDFGATTQTNTLAGVGCQAIGAATFNRCADDFNVPVGQTWTINQVIVFVYQTGAATNPVVGANLRIFNGSPAAGGTVVFGDTTTNRLASSTDSGIFRIFNSGPPLNSAPGTTRRIWQVAINVAPAVVLTAGNYWIDFQVDAGAGGNFAPPTTIAGTRGAPFNNALQSLNGGAYALSFDDGNPATAPNVPNSFPFKLDGTIAGAPLAPRSRVLDFNGDNRTDFAVARSASAVEQTTWLISDSAGGQSGAQWGTGVGFPTADRATPADYDGDGKTDIAVWRSLSPSIAAFYILNSNGNTLNVQAFGQAGDDPTIVGDYDGDGKADPAVYRAGATAGAQSNFYYRGSLNNPSGTTTLVPFGLNGDIAVPGDFDGDRRFDFHVARNNGGQLTHYQQLTTAGFAAFPYGLNIDKLVTGDFDADGKTDIGAVRTNGVNLDWYILQSATNQIWYETYGSSATDYVTLGDYDGDNKTDIVVWRSGQGASDTNFFLRNTFTSPRTFEWGQSSGANSAPDYPVANFSVK